MTPPKNDAASRLRTTFWPEMTTSQAAHAAAMQGVWVSVFICAVTSLAVMAGLGDLNAYAFIDVALFAAIGLGIWKHSRTAAVAGLALYLLERIVQMTAGAPAGTLVISVIFLLCYANAVRGTFAWHRLKAGAPRQG